LRTAVPSVCKTETPAIAWTVRDVIPMCLLVFSFRAD